MAKVTNIIQGSTEEIYSFSTRGILKVTNGLSWSTAWNIVIIFLAAKTNGLFLYFFDLTSKCSSSFILALGFNSTQIDVLVNKSNFQDLLDLKQALFSEIQVLEFQQ